MVLLFSSITPSLYPNAEEAQDHACYSSMMFTVRYIIAVGRQKDDLISGEKEEASRLECEIAAHWQMPD